VKAAVVEGSGTVTVRDLPVPAINEYQALVKIKACSICNGTDSKIVEGKLSFVKDYPAVLGHESVGQVVEIGSKVTRYKVGDMVFRAGASYPGNNPVASFWGGFAEYGTVDDMYAQKNDGLPHTNFATMQQIIPPDISLSATDATMLITYKEILSFLQNFGVKPGESVLIWGTGPVSLSCVLFAKILGAHPVICCGRREEALLDATAMGADYTINVNKQGVMKTVMEITGGLGMNKIVDGVGDFGLVQSSIPMVATCGEIGIYGIAPGEGDKMINSTLDFGKRRPPYSIRFLGPAEGSAHDQIMSLVKLGMIDSGKLIDRIVSLDEIAHGFELIWNKKARKVVVAF